MASEEEEEGKGGAASMEAASADTAISAEKALVEEEEGGPSELVEDTASSSSRDDDDDDDSEDNDDDDHSIAEGDDEEENPMPLLNFTRLFGSLPRHEATETSSKNKNNNNNNNNRAFSVPSTCAAMGQVVLSPSDAATAATTDPIPSTTTTTTPDARPSQPQQQDEEATRMTTTTAADPLLSREPYYIVAMGFQNGTIELVDARTGVAIVPSLLLREESSHREAIVDVSFDASGTYLAGVDAGRMACIWEFKFTTTATTTVTTSTTTSSAPTASTSNLQPQQFTAAAQQQQEAGVFSSFMSAFKGGGGGATTAPPSATNPPTSQSNPESTAASTTNTATSTRLLVPGLTTSSIQMSRISYPRSFGTPTCIVLDPSYKRKREKAVLTGFLDGRLVLTKRGMLFSRRTDAIIYQASLPDSNIGQGIEAIEWRGSLAAWADASGIRLFDTDTLTRIAHIDRPTGARPNLYPTLSSLRPTLRFETSHYLLVAWGDCLMGLSITDHGAASQQQQQQQQQSTPTTQTQANNDATESPPQQQQQQQQQQVARRRTVECAMAWELDCVACGVVPLDAEHCVVLGLVTPSEDDDDDNDHDDADVDENSSGNDLEVQFVSKKDGSILYSNILPLLREQQQGKPKGRRGNANAQAIVSDSASSYTLLSSFALPRMEDVAEAAQDQEMAPEEDFEIQVSLFTPSRGKRFVDSHLKWDLKTVLAGEDDKDESNKQTSGGAGHDDAAEEEDTQSVDSDDYGFIFRPLTTTTGGEANAAKPATPPLMVIASSSDAVLSRMRDVDDAVAHALEEGKSAVALRRALRQKRRIRRFPIRQLVNEYFYSLLRIPRNVETVENNALDTRKPLSIRRLKLAAKAMPALFGGDIELWEKWVSELEKIPGALFVLSDHLPVRDPKLPKELYGRVLTKMLEEIDQLAPSSDTQQASQEKEQIFLRAEECFLNTMTGWGPTNFLKEHIKLCKYKRDAEDSTRDDTVMNAEARFARRFTQTSAGYLTFPVSNELADGAGHIRAESHYDTKKALFDVDKFLATIAARTPVISGSTEHEEVDSDSEKQNSSIDLNSRVSLDAMARLNMMKGEFGVALRCFLAIAALHSARPLEDFEAGAVDFSDLTGDRDIDKPFRSKSGIPYTFVLEVIDSHHLHQCLLDDNFLSSLKTDKMLPLFSLLQLVGLRQTGDFLIEHCVAPQASSNASERRGTLPLNLVAHQLEGNPKFLHWYLHLVFTKNPEIYVKFPNTAYPPKPVTDLHRRHFDLYVEFAGAERNSAEVLSDIETYKVGDMTTPLLCFLKAALPLGGIRPKDAKKVLESERAKDKEVEFSHSFALELAYIIEHYGEETEEEAREILDLYVKGAKSLTLAVSFAQRNSEYSSMLWNILIEHCLTSSGPGSEASNGDQIDGSLFGYLLEAAALYGADLAHLVTQIPHKMNIENLRPRLVAAVADYRLKLKMHEAASEATTAEMISILRELSHRSRRGARFQLTSEHLSQRKQSGRPAQASSGSDNVGNEGESSNRVLPKSLRTVQRCDHHKLSLAPPIR